MSKSKNYPNFLSTLYSINSINKRHDFKTSIASLKIGLFYGIKHLEDRPGKQTLKTLKMDLCSEVLR